MIDITQEQIMEKWSVKNTDTPLLSIKCMSFNHEKYISQCIEGFLIQKTTFPFEILIHDDCSTDGTESIVKEYEKKFPQIIKGIYETENQWQKGGGAHHTKIDAAMKGKYIAICEGDDYWIDENKLQMQVDFLENNPEYGMCYTKAKQYLQNSQKFTKKPFGSGFDGFEDLLKNGNRIPTLTTVYRKDLLDRYQKEIQPNNKGWLMGDYPMWLYFSYESKIKFIEVVTAAYRVLENSASHSVDVEKQIKFTDSIFCIKEFFSTRYNVFFDESIKNLSLFNLCFSIYRKSFDIKIIEHIDAFYFNIQNKTFISKLKYFLVNKTILLKLLNVLIKIKEVL